MGKIRILPELIANKIAAGEVVERPASIVKELVENSLDAGADRIEIAVRHGGKSLIRVADNGSGMTAEDAQLAAQRHATSKIEKAEDLEAVQSFGFRGEALASIAAVSRFTMQTRVADAQEGTELVIEGGSLVKARACSAAQGTVMEVRDLFFNTPARRKFLKQDSTEFGHVLDAVTCLALANLNIHFRLISSDNLVLDLLPAGDIGVRARAVFGDDWSDQVVPVKGEIPYAKLSGLIGKPALASGNRARQFFFINRRWVKAYGLAHGLQAGYHGFLMQNQFPAAVLFFELDPRHVDVNVHPTKQQVRLSHEAMIKSLIERTVHEALRQNRDLAPHIRAGEIDAHEGLSGGGRQDSFPFRSLPADPPAGYKVAEGHSVKTEVETPYGNSPSEWPIRVGESVHVTKILGQIHRTYIAAETEEGYVLVDQHAAHERVMFEALMRSFNSKDPASQGLLMEEVIELHPRQVEIMKGELEFLNRLGFEVEGFGDRSFVIRAVPAILADENPATVLKEFVDEKEAGKSRTKLKGREEDVAALIACKRRSVKAAHPLAVYEMEELLRRLGRCENPFNCPHGRPSFIRYLATDLEKQFKRKV